MHHFSKIKSHNEVKKQQESMFFLLFLLDDSRIRIHTYLLIKDPDGPKPYGSGSGSGVRNNRNTYFGSGSKKVHRRSGWLSGARPLLPDYLVPGRKPVPGYLCPLAGKGRRRGHAPGLLPQQVLYSRHAVTPLLSTFDMPQINFLSDTVYRTGTISISKKP